MKTYDIYFSDSENSNNLGFNSSYEDCLNFIKCNNHPGSKKSYFPDYKGGVVSIYCNEDEVDVYTEDIK